MARKNSETCGYTDFRKQIPGLIASITLGFKLDPYNGDYTIRGQDLLKDMIVAI